MTTREQEHMSLWGSIQMPRFSRLQNNIDVDVCIVGGGISGMTTAYHLLKAGQSVAVLDDGAVGGGETSRTTAHISSVMDHRYSWIEKRHGADHARLVAESHANAIGMIEAIIFREEIDCEFARVDGYLMRGEDDASSVLNAECEAATRAGLSVKKLDSIPGVPFQSGVSLCFSNQAQMHPMKYLAGLTQGILDKCGMIFSSTHVSAVHDGPHPSVTTSDGFTVKAKHVVVATNSPINHRLGMHTKQASYRSYVIGMEIPRDYMQQVLIWDTNEPFHYVRTTRGGDRHDILIVGGEDHRTGQDHRGDDHFVQLEHWTRERFPLARKVLSKWSGQILETNDGLAFIGRDPTAEGVYIATGDCGNGITYGTIAGSLISDLILGLPNPWATLYDPARINMRSMGTFAIENTNSALHYASWLTPGDTDEPAEIRRSTGAVVRRGLTKVAVYRDHKGVCHETSAVCPHLGGFVAWNDTEKTWDCPCHGSRFDRLGKVINGPALENLKPILVSKNETKHREPAVT